MQKEKTVMAELDRIPTPHIEAKAGDFADLVLMPGDPLRAKYVAEHYFEDPVLSRVSEMSSDIPALTKERGYL